MGLTLGSMPSILVSDVMRRLDEHAPVSAAEAWDNVGLLLGSSRSRVRSVIVSHDLTPTALSLARRKRASLIVVHHPCIFPRGKGPSRILEGSTLYDAIGAKVAVYASHTNFDRCALEVSDRVAKSLRISIRGRLLETPTESLMKLSVFVPHASLEKVREAAFDAGAGHVGAYDSCSFSSEGVGTFRGGAGSRPFIGKPARFERAREQKLEVVFPRGLENSVVRSVREAHPYEEVAYDLWKVDNPPAREGSVRGLGYGFFGDLARPTDVSKLIPQVARTFRTRGGIFTGKNRKIRRIAFCPGKGSSFTHAAISNSSDLFVTGEVGYHAAREAASQGLGVLEIGHTESEYFFPIVVGKWLRQMRLSVTEFYENLQEKRLR